MQAARAQGTFYSYNIENSHRACREKYGRVIMQQYGLVLGHSASLSAFFY
jgi:hypothetical protein